MKRYVPKFPESAKGDTIFANTEKILRISGFVSKMSKGSKEMDVRGVPLNKQQLKAFSKYIPSGVLTKGSSYAITDIQTGEKISEVVIGYDAETQGATLGLAVSDPFSNRA